MRELATELAAMTRDVIVVGPAQVAGVAGRTCGCGIWEPQTRLPPSKAWSSLEDTKTVKSSARGVAMRTNIEHTVLR